MLEKTTHILLIACSHTERGIKQGIVLDSEIQ